jgi:hypothetical protein
MIALGHGFARAETVTYRLEMTGAQEAPGPGDADGLGTGTLSLDALSGQISWDFAYSNIAAPTAMHIHGPNGSAGNSAGVYIGLGAGTTGSPGTLIGSLIHPDLTQISTILGNPTDFYVNIHNADFPPGAIRGQLGTLVPEPGSVILLSIGAGLLALRRRRHC